MARRCHTDGCVPQPGAVYRDAMPELQRDGDVFVLHLGEGDLRFSPDFLGELHAALDEIERGAADEPGSPCALVTTASGKIWHNGLDLDHLGSLGDGFPEYLAEVHHVFGRFLTIPVPTVAALQGHAFAGGAMMALAHDVRVMRADRGYLCLPEIDLGMTFTPAMAALIAAKLPQPALHRMAVLGERIGGTDAASLGVVTVAVDGDDATTAAAVEQARHLAGKAKPAIAGIRRDYYGAAIDLLTA